MTDREILATFKQIADTMDTIVKQQEFIIDSLETHGEAIRLLLDESITNDKKVFNELDEQIEGFFKGAMKK